VGRYTACNQRVVDLYIGNSSTAQCSTVHKCRTRVALRAGPFPNGTLW
jgi:hypothetical protein